MIRMTTGGVLKNYRVGLMGSFVNQYKAQTTMLTQRNFNSYAEDPSAASRAFQLRRSLSRVEVQADINDANYRKYQQAVSSIDGIKDLLSTRKSGSNSVAWGVVLEGLDDPKGDSRAALGKVLSELADTVVQSMNTTYGETFVFAGADGMNVPFDFNEDGILTYRGIPVDAGLKTITDGGAMVEVDQNGVPTQGGGYYVDLKNSTLMSEAEYKKLTEPPLLTVVDDNNLAALTAMKVDSTTGQLDPNGDSWVLADNVTYVKFAGDGGLLFDEADYGTLLKDDNGNFLTVDENGNLDPDGEYYLEISDAMTNVYPLPVTNLWEDANGAPITVDANGNFDPNGKYYVVSDNLSTISEEDYKKLEEDLYKLDFLSTEKYFVDIGLGMKENETTGKLIESSAFNAAIQGINFLGYGLDEDGDPKNIISLLKQMSELCTSYLDEPWDKDSNNQHWEEFNRLAGKLDAAIDKLDVAYVELDAGSTKLKNNAKLLEADAYTLTEQISGIEDVNMADAISAFLYAQYCYSAALKAGSTILSPSLMDYLS